MYVNSIDIFFLHSVTKYLPNICSKEVKPFVILRNGIKMEFKCKQCGSKNI